MKLAGRELKKCNSHTIVIPRTDDKPIVLIARAILDYSTFEKLCPDPKPPIRMKAGGEKIANFQDPRYKLALESFGRRRVAWIILESLRLGSPELEWEKVDLGDPNTWEKYTEELQESGFSWAEIGMITQGCFIANSLDESKIEEARASFLASQLEEVVDDQSTSPMVEVSATPSGEPASV